MRKGIPIRQDGDPFSLYRGALPLQILFGLLTEHMCHVAAEDHVDLAAHGEVGGIAATVDVSEMMGSAVHLHVSACGKDVVIVVQTMDMTGHQLSSFTSGNVINFTFNGNVAHLFNKETGKNLEF